MGTLHAQESSLVGPREDELKRLQELLPIIPKIKADHFLKNTLLGRYRYFDAGRDYLCTSGPRFAPPETIDQETESFFEKKTGFPIIEYKYYDNDPGQEDYTVRFDEDPVKRLKLSVFKQSQNFASGNFSFSGARYIVQMDRDENADDPNSKGLPFDLYVSFRVFLNDDCDLITVEKWNYHNDHPDRKELLNAKGVKISESFANRRVRSLETIYGKIGEEVLDLAKKTASKNNRVIVAELDSGVDYNHPLIAAKILRVDEEKREKLEQIYSKLKSELDQKKTEFRKLGFLDRWWGQEKHDRETEGLTFLVNRVVKSLQEVSLGWDFDENDEEPYDSKFSYDSVVDADQHGTHVAGIITGTTDEIALLPLRVSFGPKIENENHRLLRPIDYAYSRGARILNFSGNATSDEFRQAIEKYPDMLFIVAAGNGDKNGKGYDIDQYPLYPASYDYPNLISVASCNDQGELSSFSNFGVKSVHLAAPGEEILSCTPEMTCAKYSGTSMAAPQVTRVAARMKYLNPKLSPNEIIFILGETSLHDLRLEKKLKFSGVLNEENSLKYVSQQIQHDSIKEKARINTITDGARQDNIFTIQQPNEVGKK